MALLQFHHPHMVVFHRTLPGIFFLTGIMWLTFDICLSCKLLLANEIWIFYANKSALNNRFPPFLLTCLHPFFSLSHSLFSPLFLSSLKQLLANDFKNFSLYSLLTHLSPICWIWQSPCLDQYFAKSLAVCSLLSRLCLDPPSCYCCAYPGSSNGPCFIFFLSTPPSAYLTSLGNLISFFIPHL